MKKLSKILITSSSVLAASGGIACAIALNSRATQPISPKPTPITPEAQKIFNIKNDTCYGIRPEVSQEQVLSYCKGKTLKLPAVKTIAADAFKNYSLPNGVTNIEIPYTTETIDDYAFFGNNAESLTFEDTEEHPAQLYKIGDSSFAFMHAITSIKFPKSLIESTDAKPIGDAAFLGCNVLAEIDISASTKDLNLSNSQHPFRGLPTIGKFIMAEPTVKKNDEQEAFFMKTVAKSNYTGSEIMSFYNWKIGDESDPYHVLPQKFMTYDNKNVWTGVVKSNPFIQFFASIYVPSTTKGIDENNTAMHDLGHVSHFVVADIDEEVTTFTIPANFAKPTEQELQQQGGWLLNTVHLGNNIHTIGASAFENCNNLNTVTINGPINTIDDSAFCNCTNLQSFTCSEITGSSIGTSAFAACGNFEAFNVNESNSVTTIGDAAFAGDTGLHFDCAVTFPNLTEVGDLAFAGSSIITTDETIRVTTGTNYKEGAFYNTHVKHVVFDNGVTSDNISNLAFAACEYLEDVDFSAWQSVPEGLANVTGLFNYSGGTEEQPGTRVFDVSFATNGTSSAYLQTFKTWLKNQVHEDDYPFLNITTGDLVTNIVVLPKSGEIKYSLNQTFNNSNWQIYVDVEHEGVTQRYTQEEYEALIGKSMVYETTPAIGTTLTKTGVYQATIRYAGLESNFTYEVVDGKYITSVAVTGEPAKKEFAQGESLDLTGLEVTATYSDGSTAVLDGTKYTTNKSDIEGSVAGKYTLKITSVTGFVLTKSIDVCEITITGATKKVVGFQVATKGQVEYKVGDKLTLSGFVILPIYEGGEIGKGITPESGSFTTDPAIDSTLSTQGKFTVNVTKIFDTTFEEPQFLTQITVGDSGPAIEAVAITKYPTKTSYYFGETLNIDDIEGTVTYQDKSTKSIGSHGDITPDKLTTNPAQNTPLTNVGDNTVTITAIDGDECPQPVDICTATVAAPIVKGWSFDTSKVKTEYEVGDKLDMTGLSITATLAKSEEEGAETYDMTFDYDPINKNVTFSPEDGHVFTEEEKSESVQITMTAVFGIELKAAEDVMTVTVTEVKTIESVTFTKGEDQIIDYKGLLDFSNLNCEITYGGEAKSVQVKPSEITFVDEYGYEWSSTSAHDDMGSHILYISKIKGKNIPTPTSQDQYKVFNYTVNAPTITNIAVTGTVTQTKYTVGDRLSLSGITVTITIQYESGGKKVTEDIEITSDKFAAALIKFSPYDHGDELTEEAIGTTTIQLKEVYGLDLMDLGFKSYIDVCQITVTSKP